VSRFGGQLAEEIRKNIDLLQKLLAAETELSEMKKSAAHDKEADVALSTTEVRFDASNLRPFGQKRRREQSPHTRHEMYRKRKNDWSRR
jgi:hypothetical protein